MPCSFAAGFYCKTKWHHNKDLTWIPLWNPKSHNSFHSSKKIHTYTKWGRNINF